MNILFLDEDVSPGGASPATDWKESQRDLKDPLENLPGADRLPAGAPFQCPPSPTCPPAAPSQEAVEEICSIFKQEHADLSQELTTLKEESFCVQKGD